jgi:hypothetical protein
MYEGGRPIGSRQIGNGIIVIIAIVSERTPEASHVHHLFQTTIGIVGKCGRPIIAIRDSAD